MTLLGQFGINMSQLRNRIRSNSVGGQGDFQKLKDFINSNGMSKRGSVFNLQQLNFENFMNILDGNENIEEQLRIENLMSPAHFLTEDKFVELVLECQENKINEA